MNEIRERRRHREQGWGGVVAELNQILETGASLAGAERVAIIHLDQAGARLDGASRLSLQLIHSLVPQLSFSRKAPFKQEVLLGDTSYTCVVLKMSALNKSDRFMLALFRGTSSISDRSIGQLEGTFNSWRHIVRILNAHPKQDLLNVCCGCQDVQVEGLGWVRWDEYLHIVQEQKLSHTICGRCHSDLYGNL